LGDRIASRLLQGILTVINLTIGPWLKDTNPVLRTFVLATIAVPIVIYVLMPRLHRIRARLLTRRTAL
jgi:antibiotic biosynthesis monooxygenase (ABM) superfamily enzyme